MRLAINGRFLTARPTGVQRVARELVSRLAERADVTLRVPRGCVVPEPLRAATRVTEGRLPGRAWEQLELPARARPGLIELDPANAGPVRGGRRVLLLHDVLPLSHPLAYAPAFRLWFRHVVGRSARRAATVVMFSEWARGEAIRWLGLDPARVRVIGQGVEPFRDPATDGDVRRVLERYDLDPPFVLALGGGDPRKNTDFLRAVIRGLDGPDGWTARPRLVLVGAGYDHIHPAGAAPAEPGVRRLPHVSDDELRALYTAARVFCFPSLGEGFGRPPLEAMACGTPVVAAGYGCAREVLGDAATILPLDVDAWRAALRRLLCDDAASDRMVAAGRRHVRACRWDTAADALLEICRAAAD